MFLGSLLEKNVDLSIFPSTITDKRMEVVDYMIIRGLIKGRIYIKNPEEAYDWGAYTAPVLFESWIVLGIFFVIFPLVIMILALSCKSCQPFLNHTLG